MQQKLHLYNKNYIYTKKLHLTTMNTGKSTSLSKGTTLNEMLGTKE
jgi:hypothetical protein